MMMGRVLGPPPATPAVRRKSAPLRRRRFHQAVFRQDSLLRRRTAFTGALGLARHVHTIQPRAIFLFPMALATGSNPELMGGVMLLPDRSGGVLRLEAARQVGELGNPQA